MHCTAEPIKLKVQFDTAFIYTVGKREGRVSGGVSDGGGGGAVCMCVCICGVVRG